MIDRPSLDPEIAASAPLGADLTPYDRSNLVTYLRLLDADAEGAPWREVAQIVLGLDPEGSYATAKATYESHLRRARWMSERGYMALLKNDKSD